MISLAFYRCLIYPALRLGFAIAAIFSMKVKAGLAMRAKTNGRWPWLGGTEGTRPLWFHCASFEFEYAKPVIRELKARFPDENSRDVFSPTVGKAVAASRESTSARRRHGTAPMRCASSWRTIARKLC